jgi:hypothetical protein
MLAACTDVDARQAAVPLVPWCPYRPRVPAAHTYFGPLPAETHLLAHTTGYERGSSARTLRQRRTATIRCSICSRASSRASTANRLVETVKCLGWSVSALTARDSVRLSTKVRKPSVCRCEGLVRRVAAQ